MSFLSSRSRAAARGFGKPLPRQEDPRLITGRGRFSDDVTLPGQVHAAFVRSPHAHARIGAIDPAAALALPGVLAVLTGRDAAADGLADLPHRPVPTNPNEFPLGGRDGSPIFVSPYPALPTDRARFAGEAVAMVIAETAALAADAAERVRVDWEPLPAVTATRAALEPGAPVLWDALGGNVCVDSVAGDASAADAAFAAAAHVVRLDTWVPRITGVPMEPRTALGVHDAATGRSTLYAGSGGSVRLKTDLAEVLRVPEAAVRVVAQDVGGNYGTRNSSYPEYALVAWAARRLGRPVKWTCDRREMFLSDYQARDLVSTMELALDADGTLPRPARHQHEQCRRPRGDLRAAQQGPRAVHHRLPRAGRRGPRARGAQQHLAALRLPQRGPAPGDVRHGAADRPGRPPSRLRPGGAAPAQPGAAGRDAVHEPLRHRLRQRRLPGRAGPRRSRSPTGPASRRAARRPAAAAATAASASPTTSRSPPARRASGRRSPCGPDGVDRRGHRHALGRARATRPSFAQLIAEWLGVEPERVRLIAGDTDRVRGRRRLALRPLDAPGRRGDGEGLRPARRAGRARSRRGCSSPRRPDVEFAAPALPVRGTDRAVDLFAVAAAALRARRAGRPRAVRSRASATRR